MACHCAGIQVTVLIQEDCKHLHHKAYESLLLYIRNQNNPYSNIPKVKQEAAWLIEAITFLSMWCWVWITSTHYVCCTRVRLKWTHKDQGWILWTTPRLKSSVHTSSVIQNSGLKLPCENERVWKRPQWTKMSENCAHYTGVLLSVSTVQLLSHDLQLLRFALEVEKKFFLDETILGECLWLQFWNKRKEYSP